MLAKASSSFLPWMIVLVLTGAVFWTIRRETGDNPRSTGEPTQTTPARDGRTAAHTKSTIRPSPVVPRGGEDFGEQGGVAAKLGIETIKARLEEITTAADREAFLRGAFRHAASLDAKTALDWAWQLNGGHPQDTALMTLLCEWSGKTVMQWLGNPDFMSEGIAATLGYCLLESGKTTPQDVAGFAWNFTSGKSRGMLIGRAAAKLAATNPDEAWAMGEGLEYLESHHFGETFVRTWANKDLLGVTRWLENPPDHQTLGDPRGLLMTHLIETDVKAAATFLNAIPAASVNRRGFITEIANTWAMRDTQAALDWANKLPTPEDRNAAAESIRKTVPVGIGAAMSGNMIATIMPDSPASRSGLASGDRILALTDAGGQWIETPGMDPVELVENIRGQPDTNVTLRIQTKDGGIRNVTITRRQIMMKSP